jgi:hypothetical protein
MGQIEVGVAVQLIFFEKRGDDATGGIVTLIKNRPN